MRHDTSHEVRDPTHRAQAFLFLARSARYKTRASQEADAGADVRMWFRTELSLGSNSRWRAALQNKRHNK
eukprot:743740-Pyramimonas_sp.AAC.2